MTVNLKELMKKATKIKKEYKFFIQKSMEFIKMNVTNPNQPNLIKF